MRKLLSDNASECVRILLNELNVRFTEKTFSFLRAHPDYPNLLSISHTLDTLGINNVAVRAGYEELQTELPKPALVHLYDNGGIFLVVTDIDETGVRFINENNQDEIQPKESFEKSWSGVTVVVDGANSKGEEKFVINSVKSILHKLKYWALGLMLILCLSLRLADLVTIEAILVFGFIATNLIGILAALLLLIELIDKNDPLVRKLCVSNSPLSKVNCASILNSNGAKFLGLFSWAEIGFAYFVTSFLYLTIFPSPSSVELMATISIIAFPYVGYSLWYQSQVVKRWCRLCLYVQAVLTIEFGLGIYVASDGVNISLLAMAYMSIVAVVVSASFAVVFPLVSASHSLKEESKAFRKLKADFEIFNVLHARQIKVLSFPNDALVYKASESANEIVIVSNPTCSQCIEIHKSLSKLIHGRTNLSVREVLLIEKDEHHPSNAVAETMVNIFHTHPLPEALEIIDDYYSNYVYNHKTWIDKYSDTKVDRQYARSILMNHVQWCIQNQFFATPLVFVNGKQLPGIYSIDDLKYLFD